MLKEFSPVSVSVPLGLRAVLVGIVLLAHAAVLGSWASAPHTSSPPHEMSVSVMMPSPPQAAPALPEPPPQPVVPAKPQVQPRAAAQEIAAPVSAPVVAPVVATANATPAVATAPALPDCEPDYQAGYLNNPKPLYPMAARRMGWQGKVIVSVEVLASGMAGQVKLHQSSGHDVLDNAALQAVRSWKFSAARQAGQLVNKWVLVPIPFILKEIE